MFSWVNGGIQEGEIFVMDAKIRNRCRVRFFLQCWRIRFTTIALSSLFATAALKVQGQDQQPLPGDASQPASDITNQLQQSAPPPKEEASVPSSTLPPLTLRSSKPKENEVSDSGDFMLGQGQVTMPIGYSLKQSLNEPGVNVPVSVIKPTRSSEYFGATVS